ncbi:hypothetical protein BaRGS_00009179 [Batillaria attramentaria]|uniref:Uncharacterized protein n=1 Tax=Batillaria attramentaria TaxID=370345 RepID=A0ABD0LKM0_9CAEN
MYCCPVCTLHSRKLDAEGCVCRLSDGQVYDVHTCSACSQKHVQIHACDCTSVDDTVSAIHAWGQSVIALQFLYCVRSKRPQALDFFKRDMGLVIITATNLVKVRLRSPVVTVRRSAWATEAAYQLMPIHPYAFQYSCNI